MAIDPLGASQAYAATRKLQSADKAQAGEAGGAAAGRSGATPSGGSAFADAAKGVAKAVADGERAANRLVVGQADPHSVIEALAVAELAVETAVTVRDKVVEAYQEILRMPV